MSTDFNDRYGMSVSQMTTCHKHFPVISSCMTCHRVCNQINTTGATSGAVTVYPSGAHEFTPGFQWGSCYSIFSFMRMFCRSLFVLLTIVLSVLLRYTDSDFPFGIFKLFLMSIHRIDNNFLMLSAHSDNNFLMLSAHSDNNFLMSTNRICSNQ